MWLGGVAAALLGLAAAGCTSSVAGGNGGGGNGGSGGDACPATAPAIDPLGDSNPCPQDGLECSYTGADGCPKVYHCQGGNWSHQLWAADGSDCATPGQTCYYPGPDQCTIDSRTVCSAEGKWQLHQYEDAMCQTCPISPPALGSPCIEGITCSYEGGCGGMFEMTCADSTQGWSQSTPAPCPP